MPIHPERSKQRAAIAANKRWHRDRPELVEDAQRELRTQTLADHIKRVVDLAPSLTAEQRDRLTVLLRPEGGDRHAA
ncbi:hypothetical protein [Streptomyces sp. NPDC048248]|uniref:hypothetical protein n=1 Tax=Streptomyces sp. NPDC048248 TaxID=3365523 RepID=UPI003719B4D2